MTHGCAVSDCYKQITADRLMCHWHWSHVPEPIQAAVIATWAAYNAAQAAGDHLVLPERRRDYLEARQLAIHAARPAGEERDRTVKGHEKYGQRGTGARYPGGPRGAA